MKKGASRAVLKIVEQEMHEAWRKGHEEGRSELARSTVPEILTARFGPEVEETSRAVALLTDDDRLAEITVFAAICPDFDSFYYAGRVAEAQAEALKPHRDRLAASPREPSPGSARPRCRSRPARFALTTGHDGLMIPDAGRSRLR